MGSECSNLGWSSKPGAYEAQLIRRCGNPYFPESQQVVSGEELAEAKTIDNQDYILARERFTQLLGEELEALPSTLSIAELHKIRERLDDLILFSMGVGGPALKIASEADEVREALISDMRAAFPNDEKALASIEKADNSHKLNVRKFYIPVMAQTLRERSPIREEDFIATILSEDPETIGLVMSLIPEEYQLLIRRKALEMMKEALDQGYTDTYIEEKISVLGGGNS